MTEKRPTNIDRAHPLYRKQHERRRITEPNRKAAERTMQALRESLEASKQAKEQAQPEDAV